MHWPLFHWIAGTILGVAWFSRIVDAALGMRHVTDIARPEWDQKPATPSEPRVTIIVPARNEARNIEAKLQNTLNLIGPGRPIEIIVVGPRVFLEGSCAPHPRSKYSGGRRLSRSFSFPNPNWAESIAGNSYGGLYCWTRSKPCQVFSSCPRVPDLS